MFKFPANKWNGDDSGSNYSIENILEKGDVQASKEFEKDKNKDNDTKDMEDEKDNDKDKVVDTRSDESVIIQDMGFKDSRFKCEPWSRTVRHSGLRHGARSEVIKKNKNTLLSAESFLRKIF